MTVELFRADIQTDGRNKASNRFSQFCEKCQSTRDKCLLE